MNIQSHNFYKIIVLLFFNLQVEFYLENGVSENFQYYPLELNTNNYNAYMCLLLDNEI